MSRRGLVWAVALAAPVLLGTVQQQRQRLPPPPEHACADPVSGEWRAHVYYAHVGQWYRFRLDVSMSAEQRLEGTIHSEWWNGGPEDEAPPPCGGRHRRRAVVEPAVGSFDGSTVVFNATAWQPDRAHPCHGAPISYLLDNFSGSLEPELQEFQSVLDADAPEWREVPTVFRRVRCTEPQEPPRERDPAVPPPPFQPPAPSVGCSCAGGW